MARAKRTKVDQNKVVEKPYKINPMASAHDRMSNKRNHVS